MATAPRIAMRAVKTLSGLSIPTQDFQEKASQTFKVGAVCVLTTGYVLEAGADPTRILGIARLAGQNLASDGLKNNIVELAHPDTVFLGNMDTSASEGNGTATQADMGVKYGIFKHSTNGTWYVDKTDTTNTRVCPFRIFDNDTAGDTIGRVLFTFFAANCELFS